MKLLLQLADTLVDKGHAHAPSIKQWVEEVDVSYKDFSTRMDEYRDRLEQTLGIQRSGENEKASSTDLLSLENAALEAADDLKQIKELNEEKRRSAKRKE